MPLSPSSSVPYYEYDSFKEKILAEGTPFFSRLGFWYLNSLDERTSRIVDIKAYLNNQNDLYLLGYCYLRNELRVFKQSGMWCIKNFTDNEEIVDLGIWLSTKPTSIIKELSAAPTDDEISAWACGPDCDNLAEATNAIELFLTRYQEQLRSIGWKISYSCEYSKRFYVSFHRFYKTGRLAKAPSVEIRFVYEDCSYINYGKVDEVKLNMRFRPRPWILSGTRIKSKYFARFANEKQTILNLLCAMPSRKPDNANLTA